MAGAGIQWIGILFKFNFIVSQKLMLVYKKPQVYGRLRRIGFVFKIDRICGNPASMRRNAHWFLN